LTHIGEPIGFRRAEEGAWLTPIGSIRNIADGQLDRLIKRVGLILLAATFVFVAFYVWDRSLPAATPIADQRLVALEAAVRESPNNIAARGALADAYVAAGRFDEAVTQYGQILETGKAVELATMGRAAAYMGLEQYDLAARDFQAVVEIAQGGEMANVDPTLEAAYYNLGLIAMKQDRAADAVAFLERALRIKRSDADALYLIGQAYTQTGATDKAEIALRRAVAFVPIGWSEPYAALVETYTRAGRTAMAAWASAMVDLTSERGDAAEPRLKALARTEAALDAAIGLGLLYETRGDTAAAAEWYTRALALDPLSDAARLGMSRVGAVSGVDDGASQ
jgi:tetratricopeptide (TPR) repeat protein